MQDVSLRLNGGDLPLPQVRPDPSLSSNLRGFSSAAPLPGLFLPLLLFIVLHSSSAHPQCLDFEPPFRPQWHLEFCTQYEDFGCCDQVMDNGIAERYWDIIDQLELEGLKLCQETLKEIMCQVRGWMMFSGLVVHGETVILSIHPFSHRPI